MSKTKPARKLVLSTQTLRSLDAAQLGDVNGGNGELRTLLCESMFPTCKLACGIR